MTDYIIVFITAPAEKGEELGEFIIKEKLGACVNVVDVEKSIYWWKGNIEREKEKLLIVKTQFSKWEDLLSKVKEVHPYTVPEIIAFPVIAGSEDYLRWIDDVLQ